MPSIPILQKKIKAKNNKQRHLGAHDIFRFDKVTVWRPARNYKRFGGAKVDPNRSSA